MAGVNSVLHFVLEILEIFAFTELVYDANTIILFILNELPRFQRIIAKW